VPENLTSMNWKNIVSGQWESNMTLQYLPLPGYEKALSVIDASVQLLVHIAASELISTPMDYLGVIQDAFSALHGVVSMADVASLQRVIGDLSLASYYMYIGSWAAAKEIFQRRLIDTVEMFPPGNVSIPLLSCFDAKTLVGVYDESYKFDDLYTCGIRSSALRYSLGLVLNDIDSETAVRILNAYNLSDSSEVMVALTGILRYLSVGVREDNFYVGSNSCTGVRKLFESIKTVTGNVIRSSLK
jgi:hypothetical protein